MVTQNKKFEKDFEQKYHDLFFEGIVYIEEMAREILRTQKRPHEFVMCMGSWFFVDKNNEIIEPYNLKYMKPLVYFMDEWDRLMKFTGWPMRFTAYGPKITDW